MPEDTRPSQSSLPPSDDDLRQLRRLETLGLMTGGVVHDLNNVLTTMLCQTALLGAAVRGQDRASMLVRELDLACGRASALSRRVLRVLRREPASTRRVSPSTLVAETRSLLQLVAGGRVKMDLALDPGVGDVLVDREQLEHVLINLVANARDAMPRGGTITVTTADAPAPEGYAGPAVPGFVGIAVSDTGDGMTPEVLERASERFFTTKEVGQGTGLGLASARAFAEASGGRLTLEAEPGRGTTVVLHLPQAPAEAPAPSRDPDTERLRPAGSETVVVVEPDDAVRGAVRETLADCGYRVLDAPTGETALRQIGIAGAVVDVVLADVGAPGMGGGGVVLQLRERGQSPSLLWMSGLPDRALDEPALEPLLRKAFTPSQLAQRVREVLDRAARERDAS